MHRLPRLLLEDRDRRRGGRDLRRRPPHIDVRREASVEEPLGEVDRLLLGADVRGREHRPLLQAPIGHVLEADLAHEGHHDRVAIALGRGDVGIGGLDRAADPAEHVHLPIGVEAGLKEIPAATGVRGSDPVLAAVRARVLTRRVDLRPVRRGRDPPRRPRLADARFGLRERQVRLHRARDQRGQEWIVEALPPRRRRAVCDDVAPSGGRRDRGELAVRRRRREVGTTVVRSDHTAAGAEQERDRDQRWAQHHILDGLGAALGAASAGCAVSTRVPSVTLAAMPVASMSSGPTPPSTSTSVP